MIDGDAVYIDLEEKDTKRDRVIAKIQKALDLANGTTSEDERNTAMAMANRLIIEYDIEAGAIGEKRTEYTHKQMRDGKYLPREAEFIVYLLERYFFVRIAYCAEYSSEGKFASIKLMGRSHHVMIAQYVFEFLKRTYKESFKLVCGRLKEKGVSGRLEQGRRSFYMGMADSIDRKLAKQRAGMGLVLVNDPGLDDLTKDLKPRNTKDVSLAMDMTKLGRVMGDKVNLHEGIEDASMDDRVLGLIDE